MSDKPKCTVCGEPMPPGEEMFKFHGYSGPCPKPPLRPSTLNPMNCECASFACVGDDMLKSSVNNGHHPQCEHFRYDSSGAAALLKQLTEGIKWWADQEDGVPEELWEAYARAVFITTGRVLSPSEAK